MKKNLASLLVALLLLVMYVPTSALAADSGKGQTYVNTQKVAAEGSILNGKAGND